MSGMYQPLHPNEHHPQEWNSTIFSLFKTTQFRKRTQEKQARKCINASIFTCGSWELWIPVVQFKQSLNLCLRPHLPVLKLSSSQVVILEWGTDLPKPVLWRDLNHEWHLLLWYQHVAVVRKVDMSHNMKWQQETWWLQVTQN